MKALVYQSLVIQIQEDAFPVHPNYQWIDCNEDVKVGDSWNGENFIPKEEPIKTMEDILRDYKNLLKDFVNRKAREKQYDSALSIATYVNSTNEQWKTEADAFIAWRDSVYIYALGVLGDVQNGGAAPSEAEFLAALPEMVWPS
jgi:hypothetical protein